MVRKITITGAAGLVGQNLIQRLQRSDSVEILAIDKHPANTAMLRRLNPGITVIEADLAKVGAWESDFAGTDTLVICHAQIGALTEAPFISNNLTATERVIAAALAAGVANVIHISSSVVNSAARDFYTETKRQQEKLVAQSGLRATILRPTLMFGWFDRKHLGWLARFMKKTPIFPIPGSGRYLRQPLFVGDLCAIILSCIDRPLHGQGFNISGLEKIEYIDMIRSLKRATGARSKITKIPYAAFALLLKFYAIFNGNPPFTTEQLAALVLPDLFEIIDWPEIFKVTPTPLALALDITFRDPTYSNVELAF